MILPQINKVNRHIQNLTFKQQIVWHVFGVLYISLPLLLLLLLSVVDVELFPRASQTSHILFIVIVFKSCKIHNERLSNTYIRYKQISAPLVSGKKSSVISFLRILIWIFIQGVLRIKWNTSKLLNVFTDWLRPFVFHLSFRSPLSRNFHLLVASGDK